MQFKLKKFIKPEYLVVLHQLPSSNLLILHMIKTKRDAHKYFCTTKVTATLLNIKVPLQNQAAHIAAHIAVVDTYRAYCPWLKISHSSHSPASCWKQLTRTVPRQQLEDCQLAGTKHADEQCKHSSSKVIPFFSSKGSIQYQCKTLDNTNTIHAMS